MGLSHRAFIYVKAGLSVNIQSAKYSQLWLKVMGSYATRFPSNFGLLMGNCPVGSFILIWLAVNVCIVYWRFIEENEKKRKKNCFRKMKEACSC